MHVMVWVVGVKWTYRENWVYYFNQQLAPGVCKEGTTFPSGRQAEANFDLS